MRKAKPIMYLDITRPVGDLNAVKTGTQLIASLEEKLRIAVEALGESANAYDKRFKKWEESEARLKRCEENLVAIATIFVHAPTMRLEARKCLEFVNPEKYPLNNQWPKIKAK